jgi:hypothetical protein
VGVLVVGVLVEVRTVVAATTTGIMVGTPLVSTGAGVGVLVADKTDSGGSTDAKAKPE